MLGAVELQTAAGMALPSILVQPKRLALLAYIALSAPDGFVRRDLLLPLLWPDLDNARARNALNKAVHHIRQALGDGVLINRGDEELGLAPGRFLCDAVDFERASDREAWSEALRFYRGDLLPGLYLSSAPAFEEWLERERSRLKRLGARTARRAAEARAAEGDVAGAAEAARFAVVLEPDDEPAVRRLIALLDQQGDRAGAMRVYEDLESRLRREFEVEPDAETRALRDAIGLRSAPTVDNPTRPPRFPAPAPPSDSVGPASESTPASRRPISARTALWILGAAALVALLAVGVLRDRSADDLPPAGTALAVLPFAPSSPDTALVRYGRDLMVLVSARLDGIAGIEVIDPIAVLAHVDVRPTLLTSSRLSAELRALGATRVLEGSLVRVGDQLRVEGRLFATEGRASLARFAVVAEADDISALADGIVLQLIDQLWEANVPRATGRATLASQSVPAVRAFLDGERLLATGRPVGARAAYQRAIEADSSFWYAHWRWLDAGEWLGVPPDSATVAKLRAHRQELPELAMALLEARLSDSLVVGGRQLAALVARYPLSWSAWFDYADYLVHSGPMYGSTRAEARSALERSVALNPGFTNAWDHIFELSLLDSDTAAASRALRALERLDAPSAHPSEEGFNSLLNDRWLFATARAGGRPQEVLGDSAAASLVGYKGGISLGVFDIIPLRWGWGAAQIEFGRSVLARSPSRSLANGQLRGIALAWATRGAWDSALVAADEYAKESPTADAEMFRFRLAVIGAWVGALSPAEAARRRVGLEAVLPDLSDGLRAETAWLDGVLAATEGNRSGIEAARRRIRTGPVPMSGWLDASLHAIALELDGASDAAVRTMAAVEADRDVAHPFNFPGSRQSYLTAVNRMVLSRGLAAGGDTVAALRNLRWTEAFPSGAELEQARVVMTGLVDLERARLEAAIGQEELARAHYRQFLRRYDMPVPAHQHLVDEARAALGQLEAIGCPYADSACGASK